VQTLMPTLDDRGSASMYQSDVATSLESSTTTHGGSI
jgi:hypothetical protein